ncbi:MAG: SIMPL domain-containing protein [Hyphomicrobiaceae bacterium]
MKNAQLKATLHRSVGAAAVMICGATLLCGAFAMAEVAQADEKKFRRHVAVSATASVTAVPDIARISAGVVTEAATARAAVKENNGTMAVLIDKLKSLGVATDDIATTQISVQPRTKHHRDGRPPEVTGYRVTNRVRITVRDLAKLGEFLDQSVEAGANQLGGITFDVTRKETLKDEARKQAMANARHRAELYAEAADAEIGRILSIQETFGRPIVRPTMAMTRAAAAESVPVEPGSQRLDVTVHATWELE